MSSQNSGISSGVFGALGNIASTAISSAFGAANSKRSYHYQRNLMNLQNELNRQNQIWTWQHGPSMSRAGFEAAGYNPILALGNLSNASPQSGLGSAVQGNQPDSDISGAASNAYQAFKLAKEKNNAEVNATNASASLATEQAKTEEFRRRQIESQTLLNSIDHQLRSKDLNWYDRKSLMQVKTGYVQAEASRLASQAAMSQANSASMTARANSQYTDLQKYLKSVEYRYIKEHPERALRGAAWNYHTKQFFGKY